MLNEAWDAVVATGKSVKIESDIAHGDAALRLVEESGRAGMVCVGHKGKHDSGPGRRGSTAVQVARSALTTVAVVRHRKLPSPVHQWIIAVLDESRESRLVLRTALDESALRQGPVLLLTSWSTTRKHGKNANALWQRVDRYLDQAYHGEMQICAIPMPDDIVEFLEQCLSIDQLVIAGANNKALTHELTTARAAKVMRNSNTSLMFVQAGAEDSDAPR